LRIPNRVNEIVKYATIPNFLTLSRLFLLPLILLFLARQLTTLALVLMALSWLSDALDGFLARRLNLTSEVGKILDHLVDKIWVGSVLAILVWTKRLPLSIALGVIIRDLLIVVGSSLLIRRGLILSSNIFGKLAGFFFAVLIITYTLQLKPLMVWVFYIIWSLLFISFISYIPLFIKSYRSLSLRETQNSHLKPSN